MWVIDNHTPFTAERCWVRDKNGAEVWVVAVRGTFLIAPDGAISLAENQEEICLVPKYRGEPGKSSLLYESDLVHTKPTTDVILHGHAYTPGGKQAIYVDATLKIGEVVKTLRIFGDRFWEQGLIELTITDPQPFEKMPLIYERAFGGEDKKLRAHKNISWEPRNPIGTGFAVESNNIAGQRLPNIENPKLLIKSWNDRPLPAGFGPIAGNWSPRAEFAGTYDEKWKKERYPLFPNDFNERFYLCSPEDQLPSSHLRGGETVELYNLTPEGRLRFELPRVALAFSTYFFSGEVVDHRPVVHSVILEPDVPRVVIVWQTTLACHPNGLKLKKTEIRQIFRVDKSGRELLNQYG